MTENYNHRLAEIINYLRGEMNQKEVGAFEREMKLDQAFAEEVEAQRVTEAIVEELRIKEFKSKVKSWWQPTDADVAELIKTAKRERLLRLIGGLGLIGILVALLVWGFKSGFFTSGTDEAATPSVPYETIPEPQLPVIIDTIPNKLDTTPITSPVIANEGSPDLPATSDGPSFMPVAPALIAEAYQSTAPGKLRALPPEEEISNFDRSIRLVASSVPDSVETGLLIMENIDSIQEPDAYFMSRFVLGHCYFEAKKYKRAASFFATVADATSTDGRRAKWFLTLSLLATQDEADGNRGWQLLEEILAARDDHPFYPEAKKLKESGGNRQ